MQRLGRIVSVTPSRNMVAKTPEAPKIGFTVVDENLTPVGKVFDVIGPVSSPYTVIKPSIKNAERLLDKQLYLLLSKNRSKS